MVKSATIRFLNNFVLTTIYTYVDEISGEMKIRENQYHIQRGDVLKVISFTEHHDHLIDIEFPSDYPVKGVANNIEKDYCEVLSQVTQKVSSGCGSCGSK